MPAPMLGRKPPRDADAGTAGLLNQTLTCEVMIAGATLNPGAKVARSPTDPHECIPATDEDWSCLPDEDEQSHNDDGDDTPAQPPPEVIGVVDPFLRDDVPINAGDLVWVLLPPAREVSGNLYTRGEYDRVWMDEAGAFDLGVWRTVTEAQERAMDDAMRNAQVTVNPPRRGLGVLPLQAIQPLLPPP